jgi:FkbM family methyltransferase
MITSSLNDSVKNVVKKYVPLEIQRSISNSLWDVLQLNWKLNSGLSVDIKSKSDWWMFNEIFVNNEYDSAIKLALKSASSNRTLTILDLGANVGLFTMRVVDLLLANENSQIPFVITAVEGSPTIYADLQSRIIREPILKDKVRLIHGLVGECQGSAKLYEAAFSARNSIFTNSSVHGVEVPYIDLNSLYSQDSEIDLLKCDIEGSELIFLENYKNLLPKVKVAILEMHHTLCNTARCIQIMKEAGFINHQTIHGKPGEDATLDLFSKQDS